MARARGLERKPAAAVVITVLFFVWLYLPILAVALFSFNDTKSLSAFTGFSTTWYDDFFHNAALLESLVASLEIASISAVAAVVLGTMLALGLERVRSRRGRVIGAITLLPLVTPEIVTGVAALLVFLPALGDFVSAQLLGGSSTFMVGNLVQQQFMEGQNWPLGSALTVGLMVALTVLMVAYLRATTTKAHEL